MENTELIKSKPPLKDDNILLKSKKVLDKLSYKISQVAKKSNKKSLVVQSIARETQHIQDNIENKLQKSFNQILNEQMRLSIGSIMENKENNKEMEYQKGAYDLMNDYWKEKAKEIAMNVCKRQVYSKQKERQQKKIKMSQSDDNFPLKPHKYFSNTEKERGKKIQKDERILAHLYTYLIPVTDYKVQNDLPQFLLFQKNNYTNWVQIEETIDSIENFCKFYKIKQCTLELQKVLELIKKKKQLHEKKRSKLKKRRQFYTPHELLSCLQNPQKISEDNTKKPGIRFYGNKGKIRAIIKIQACARGKITFQKCRKIKIMVIKVRKIQNSFRNYLFFLKVKEETKKKSLQKFKQFQQNQEKFRKDYKIKELTNKIKYEIHIPSHSMHEWQRVSTHKYAERQNGQITRIFKIVRESQIQTRIIYISPIPISNQILKYYYKILELGNAEDYKKKLIIMAPEQNKNLPMNLSLTKILYYEPSILNKIKKIVNGSYAYVVPSVPSMEFVPLCHYLNLPLYSGNPQKMLYFQHKSGTKQISESLNKNNLEDKDFGILPYSTDIYSLNNLINQLALLIAKYPQVSRWVLKIDNEICSRGIAYIDISKVIPPKLLLIIKRQPKSNILKKYLEDIFEALDENFVQKQKQYLTILCKNVYKSQKEFLLHYFSNGGVIEAAINNFEGELQNMCFCVQIQPQNSWKFVCSYYKITIKKQTTGSYHDSKMMQPPLQIQALVKALQNKQCWGYFTFQFCRIPQKFQDPNMIAQKERRLLYFNGLKCYFDELSSVNYLKEFLSKESNVLYLPLIYHPNIKKIKIQTFFHLCRLQNISFDIEKKIGNIFMFLDTLESGCIGLMTFNHTSKVETFIHAAEVMDFFNSKVVEEEINEDFLLIRNSINGFLKSIRRQMQKEATASGKRIKLTAQFAE